jgi:hypothetical protein
VSYHFGKNPQLAILQTQPAIAHCKTNEFTQGIEAAKITTQISQIIFAQVFIASKELSDILKIQVQFKSLNKSKISLSTQVSQKSFAFLGE